MTITEFKKMVSALSTYATVREKASGPETKIGVQSKDGVLKLIAGKATGGVVVTAGISSYPNVSFCVDARPLISAAKVVKGKLDLGWEVSAGGLRLSTDKGGRVELLAVGTLKETGFGKKPKGFSASAFLSGEQFGQMAKMFDCIAQDVESQTPTLHCYDNKVVLTAVSPATHAIYASLETTGKGQESSGSAYMDFWRSLRVLEQDGQIDFGPEGVVARSGIYECFSGPYLVSPYNKKTRTSEPARPPEPWPTLGWRDEMATARVVIDRKQLIEAIKGQVPNDDLGRVTLQVDTGTFEVYAFGAEAGIRLPASTTGRGVRSLQAVYLLDLLRAIESKEVELAWGTSPAIHLHGKEYSNWTILIAPVTMTN